MTYDEAYPDAPVGSEPFPTVIKLAVPEPCEQCGRYTSYYTTYQNNTIGLPVCSPECAALIGARYNDIGN